MSTKIRWGLLSLSILSLAGFAADGPVAEWLFDAGTGTTASDTTGNGHDAVLHGATFAKVGEGFALSLDGTDDYVDCTAAGSLPISGPVAISAWIMPTRAGNGEAVLMGDGMRTFVMTYYNTNLCFLYIGNGGNHVKDYLALHRWQHVAASFDGERMALWLNGRQVAGRESAVKAFEPSGNFMIGNPGPDDLPRFKGFIDNVRVYNRGLTDDEVVEIVRAEAADHGMGIANIDSGDVGTATAFFHEHPNPIDIKESGKTILFANRKVGLAFVRTDHGFQLLRLYDISARQDFLESSGGVGVKDLYEINMIRDPRGSGRDERGRQQAGLMGIMDEMAEGAFPIGSHAGGDFSWEHASGDDGATVLRLQTTGIDVKEQGAILDVIVTVELRPNDPAVRWRIAVRNRSERYGIERIRFPILPLAPIGEAGDNVFIFPRERGGYIADPFNAPTGFDAGLSTGGKYYPVDFNMQFQALYNRESNHGIFLGTQDPAASLMNIQVRNTPDVITWRPGHFPPNITFAEEHFDLPYDCITRPFQGDWFDAAQIYRGWALQQFWASKGPLLDRDDSPAWFKEAPLMLYTVLADSAEGTFDIHENLQIAAEHFQQFVEWAGMPLPANWYSWKQYTPGMTTYDVPFSSHRLYTQGRWKGLPCMNIHDGNYPKIGALPGLAATAKKLRKIGAMICPYVATEIFDQGPAENSPYAAEAKPYMVRDLYGVLRTWSVETPWQACVCTPWWRERLRETCVEMVRREHVPGFYLDVMQGAGLPCYWTPHGHSAAGGDSMTKGMHDLVEIIRNAVKAEDPEVIITGENCTENVIDVVDGTLTVTLWPENRVPLFAAVYQDYVVRYGTEMIIDDEYGEGVQDDWIQDAFFIEAASMFLEGMQVGRIRLKPRSGILSFENPAQQPVFDFLAQVVGYYRNESTRQFLAYGQLLRPVTFAAPPPMLRYRDTSYPALMSGTFRNRAGQFGIFIANAGREPLPYAAAVDLTRYGLDAETEVEITAVSPQGKTISSGTATGHVDFAGTLSGRSITMYQVTPK